MKHSMIGRLSFVTFFATLPLFAAAKPQANASYQAVIRAELTAKNSALYSGGSLSLDGREHTLELTLQPKMPECAEGMSCIQMMPEPITYNLEKTTTEIDQCGIIRTHALVDNRAGDGIYLSVVVNNNLHSTCPTLVALKAMDVMVSKKYYDRIKGQEVEQFDNFFADDFALINPAQKGDVPFSGKLISARYANKSLQLKLQYAGGNVDHAFDLKWGACKDVKLLNSVISECDVTILETEGSDDSAEALVTKTHSIDLSGLAQAYIINLNGTRVLIH